MLSRYSEKKCPLRLDADHGNIFHILTNPRYDTWVSEREMEALTVMTAGAFEIAKCKKESPICST